MLHSDLWIERGRSVILSFESLTNARLRALFKNNFDLCNFAINIGRAMVLSGSQATLDEILDVVEERAEEREDAIES